VLVQPEVLTEEQARTASGLYTQVGDKVKYLTGLVRYIESDNLLGIRAGDTIIYRPDADFCNTIEGEEYFVMHQRELF